MSLVGSYFCWIKALDDTHSFSLFYHRDVCHLPHFTSLLLHLLSPSFSHHFLFLSHLLFFITTSCNIHYVPRVLTSTFSFFFSDLWNVLFSPFLIRISSFISFSLSFPPPFIFITSLSVHLWSSHILSFFPLAIQLQDKCTDASLVINDMLPPPP